MDGLELQRRINAAWDLSNDTYPAIYAKCQRFERRRARLKWRETLRYRFCKAVRGWCRR